MKIPRGKGSWCPYLDSSFQTYQHLPFSSCRRSNSPILPSGSTFWYLPRYSWSWPAWDGLVWETSWQAFQGQCFLSFHLQLFHRSTAFEAFSRIQRFRLAHSWYRCWHKWRFRASWEIQDGGQRLWALYCLHHQRITDVQDLKMGEPVDFLESTLGQPTACIV